MKARQHWCSHDCVCVFAAQQRRPLTFPWNEGKRQKKAVRKLSPFLLKTSAHPLCLGSPPSSCNSSVPDRLLLLLSGCSFHSSARLQVLPIVMNAATAPGSTLLHARSKLCLLCSAHGWPDFLPRGSRPMKSPPREKRRTRLIVFGDLLNRSQEGRRSEVTLTRCRAE